MDETDPDTRRRQQQINRVKTELVLVDAQQKMQFELRKELQLTRNSQDYWMNQATVYFKAYHAVNQSLLFDIDANTEILNLLITKMKRSNEE